MGRCIYRYDTTLLIDCVYVKVVLLPMILKPSRFFSFIPAKNINLLLLLGLWGCGPAQLIQAPVRQPDGLSIRRGKSSNLILYFWIFVRMNLQCADKAMSAPYAPESFEKHHLVADRLRCVLLP
jgi:hypothetical protein